MARKRASMREGPLAELFRATEAAQRRPRGRAASSSSRHGCAQPEPPEETAEHVPECGREAVRRRPSRPPARAQAGARAEAQAQPKARREPERARRGSSRCPTTSTAHRGRDSPRLPRGHPRGRRRRRRPERGQPDDRRRDHAGRVRRAQHGHPAAPDERRAGEDPHRPRADRGPRLGRRPRARASRRRRGVRPDQAFPARLGHGLRRPPAKAAAPARARRRSSRASPGSSAR